MGLGFLLSSCQPNSYLLEPAICYKPPEKLIERSSSAFEDLTDIEFKEDWGKEVLIGDQFAREMDLYRAITGYKRARILIPPERIQRRLQIEYDIILCYYLGGKYGDVIETFENGELTKLSSAFPAFNNLLIILYDSYQKAECLDKAAAVLKLIENHSPETAQQLTLSTAFSEADIETLDLLAGVDSPYPVVNNFLMEYQCESKSVKRAQFLNAALPGAGYYYVGLKQSALTSFVLNVLFAAAAYQFFDHGYIAAGAITTSLELGWYIGGINGAGLAAKEYNERFYEERGKEAFIKSCLFPVLMFETFF